MENTKVVKYSVLRLRNIKIAIITKRRINSIRRVLLLMSLDNIMKINRDKKMLKSGPTDFVSNSAIVIDKLEKLSKTYFELSLQRRLLFS